MEWNGRNGMEGMEWKGMEGNGFRNGMEWMDLTD